MHAVESEGCVYGGGGGGGVEKGRWKRIRKGSLCRSLVCSGGATGSLSAVCLQDSVYKSCSNTVLTAVAF